MSANSALRITELDANAIKENLKTFLKGQDAFTDFNFEGSGINILLDLLSYNTHYLSFYMNMLGAEAFLDTAQLRSSLISHAKHLGYVPNSLTPATAFVTVKVTPTVSEDQLNQSLSLPRWTKFVGESLEGVNHNYVTVNSNNAVKVNSSFTFSNVVLKQGDIQTRTFAVDSGNPKREYYIPSANVDINEIYVTVQESTTNTNFEIYNRFEDLTELRGNSAVYFIEEAMSGNGYYKLFFGDGYLGKKPTNGNIVTVTYLDTAGDIGNGANSFILFDDISGYSGNVRIFTSSPSTGGAKRETLEEIRYRAPLHYTIQNRAVIGDDYAALLLKDYPNLESISVWGGEEETPPVYGKVFIALKPVSNYYITELEKQRIINDFVKNRNVMTIIPEIINPDYTYLKLDIRAYYDKNKTNLDESELRTIIRNAILQYRDDRLQQFDSKFRVSNLQRYIENSNEAINSTTVNLFVQKRILPTLEATKNYEIDFKQRLKKGVGQNKLFTFPEFKVYDSRNVLRNCQIEEVPLSYTGVSRIRILDGGQNYEDAKVTISGDGTGATATARIANKKIKDITLVRKGSNYLQASIAITSNTGYSASAVADVQADEGTLRLFYFAPNGTKVIVNSNIGTINYKTGLISINNLNVYSIIENNNYNFDVITFNINPDENDISPIKNAILDLDENDGSSIKITMISE